MGKLSKQIIMSATILALSSAATSQIPFSIGIYDIKPKNSFRGGSTGKGGKIKYRRG